MSSEQNVFAIPNIPTPSMPVIYDPKICTGCNNCVETCPIDVFIPNPRKGAPPIVLHAEECWYCGCCVDDCPCPRRHTVQLAAAAETPLEKQGERRSSPVVMVHFVNIEIDPEDQSLCSRVLSLYICPIKGTYQKSGLKARRMIAQGKGA